MPEVGEGIFAIIERDKKSGVAPLGQISAPASAPSHEQLREDFRATMGQALRKSPDEVAKNRSTALQLGTSTDYVAEDKDLHVEAKVQGFDYDKYLASAPGLAEWTTKSQDNADLASDEMDHLSSWESGASMAKRRDENRVNFERYRSGANWFTSLIAPANRGFWVESGKLAAGALEIGGAIRGNIDDLGNAWMDAYAPDGRSIMDRANDVAQRIKDAGKRWTTERSTDTLGGKLAEKVGELDTYISRDVKATHAVTLTDPKTGKQFTNAEAFKDPWLWLNTVTENAPQLAFGQVMGIRAYNAAIEAGNTVAKASILAGRISGSVEAAQIFGDEYDSAREKGLGVGRAGATALAITIPSVIVSQGIPNTRIDGGLEGLFFKKMAESAEKAPGLKGRAIRALFGMGKEGLEENVQEQLSMLGQRTYDPNAFDNWTERTLMSTFGGAVLGGFGGALVGAHTLDKAKASQSLANVLQDIADHAQDSKLNDRAPEKFAELVNAQAQKDGQTHVMVPIDKFNQTAAALDMTPQALLETMHLNPEQMSDVQAQLTDIHSTQADLLLPIGNYASIAATPIGKALAQDVRLHQGQPTMRETAENQARVEAKAEEIVKSYTETPEAAASIKVNEIQAKVEAQLVAAGRPKSEAKAQAALFGKTIATMAAGQNVTPDVVLAHHDFSVNGGVVSARTLNPTLDAVNKALDNARTGTDTVSGVGHDGTQLPVSSGKAGDPGSSEGAVSGIPGAGDGGVGGVQVDGLLPTGAIAGGHDGGATQGALPADNGRGGSRSRLVALGIDISKPNAEIIQALKDHPNRIMAKDAVDHLLGLHTDPLLANMTEEQIAFVANLSKSLEELEHFAPGSELLPPAPMILNQVNDLPAWEVARAAWYDVQNKAELTRMVSSAQAENKPLSGADIIKIKQEQARVQQEKLDAIRGQMNVFHALGVKEIEFLPQSADLGDPRLGPLRTNVDDIYKFTFDASAECVKRLKAAANAYFIQAKRNGMPLTDSELIALTSIMRMRGDMSPCLYCYVESMRRKSSEFVGRGFRIALGQEAIPDLKKAKKGEAQVREEGDDDEGGSGAWSKTMRDLAKAAREEVKKLKLKQSDIDVNLVMKPDVAGAEGAAELRAKAPALYAFLQKQLNNAKSNKVKLYESYKGQLFSLVEDNPDFIKEMNGYAGFRIFSSSDFQVEHVCDLVQLVYDLNILGGKAHAYSKVEDFIKIFGGTGIKIQCSIFAVEVNGQLSQDTTQGMDWKVAEEFTKKYPHVGAVLVASSDHQAAWARDVEWISYSIPYHYSGTQGIHSMAAGYQDFTTTQAEVWLETRYEKGKDGGFILDKDGKKIKQHVPKIRMHELDLKGGVTDAEMTRRYLELCMKRGIVPVFPALMFKDFKPTSLEALRKEFLSNPKNQKLDDETVTKKVHKLAQDLRLIQTKEATAKWAAMVASGQIDYSLIHDGFAKFKKDYARTDTPFEVVDPAGIDQKSAGDVLRKWLEDRAAGLAQNEVDPEVVKLFDNAVERAKSTGKDVGAMCVQESQEFLKNEAMQERKQLVNTAAQTHLGLKPSSPNLDGPTGGVTFDDSAVKVMKTFYQGPTGQVLGSLHVGDHALDLKVFAGANASTSAHEFGHFYLVVLEDLATRPDATQTTKDNLAKIRSWLGAKDGVKLTHEQHERFADTHLEYLKRGVAPTEELRGAFRSYTVWLSKIWQQVKAGMAKSVTPLDAEAIGIYDRMYATEQEIEKAKGNLGQPMFATAEAAGMTETQYRAYVDAGQGQIAAAKEQMLAVLIKQMTRERSKERRELLAEVHARIKGEIDAMPEYQTLSRLTGGEVKLDKQSLIDAGIDPATLVQDGVKKVWSTKDGIPADAAAEILGVGTADDLIQLLQRMDTRKVLAEKMAEEEVKKSYPDSLLDPEELRKEAVQALNDNHSDEVLAVELQILRKLQIKAEGIVKAETDSLKAEMKAQNQDQQALAQAQKDQANRQSAVDANRAKAAAALPDMQAFRLAARQIIARMRVGDLVPNKYLQAMGKHANEALKAMAARDYATAADAKEAQILSRHLYVESIRAQREIEKADTFNKKLDRRTVRDRIALADKSSDPNDKTSAASYLKQIDSIRQRFGMGVQFFNQQEENLQAWCAYNPDAEIAPWILDERIAKPRESLTVSEYGDVIDALMTIKTLALHEVEIEVDGKKVEIQAVRDLFDAITPDGERVPTHYQNDELTVGEKAGHLIRGVDAQLQKVEWMADRFDRGNVNGPFRTFIKHLIDSAMGRKLQLGYDISTKLQALADARDKAHVARARESTGITIPGRTTPLSYQQLTAFVLNLGTTENRKVAMEGEHLLDGEGNPLPIYDEMLHKLPASEYAFIQGVWDVLETLRPMIADAQKYRTGKEMKWKNDTPFQVWSSDNKLIEMRGGYYPLAADRNKTDIGRTQSDPATVGKGPRTRPRVETGFTKKVTGATYRLRLDFAAVLTGHLSDVITNVTCGDAVTTVNRVISDLAIRTALEEKLGTEYVETLRPWLLDSMELSRSEQEGGAIIDFISRFKSGAVVATIGGSIPSVWVQISDVVKPIFAPGISNLALLTARWDMTMHPQALVAEIKRLSPNVMRFRGENFNREMRDVFHAHGLFDAKNQAVANYLMSAFEVMDAQVTFPTWLAVYRNNLAKGGTEAEAVKDADRIVNRTFQAGDPANMSAMFRSKNKWQRLFTVFQNDANTWYGIISASVASKHVGRMSMALMGAFAAQAFGQILKNRGWGGDDDDDEKKKQWAVKQFGLSFTGSLPIVGPMIEAGTGISGFAGGGDFTNSMMTRSAKAFAKPFSDWHKNGWDGLDWEDVTRSELEAFGTWAGVPGTAQIARTWKYNHKVRSGEIAPASTYESIKGHIFGQNPNE